MKHKKLVIISVTSLLVVVIGVGSFYGYKAYLDNDIKRSNENALKDLSYAKEIMVSKLNEGFLELSNVKNKDSNSPMVRNYTFNLRYYDFIKCMDYDFIVDKISVYASSIYDLKSYETPSWDYILKSSFEELNSLDGYFIIDSHAYDIGAIMRIRYYTSNFKGKAVWVIRDDEVSLFESSFSEPSNHIYPHTQGKMELD